MWAAWVIHDVSAEGKASESAAAKGGWMSGLKNQIALTKGGQFSMSTCPPGSLQIATLLIDE
jgi:hypothetical protein